MKGSEILTKLIKSLNSTESAFSKGKIPNWEGGFPNFATAENGLQCSFSKESLLLIRELTSSIYSNNKDIASSIQESELTHIIRQSIADFYMSSQLKQDSLNKLKKYIEKKVNETNKELTHHFPAWVHLQGLTPFSIGPVLFLDRESWVDSVSFHPNYEQKHLNKNWKKRLKKRLNKSGSLLNLKHIKRRLISKLTTNSFLTKLFSKKLLKYYHSDYLYNPLKDCTHLVIKR